MHTPDLIELFVEPLEIAGLDRYMISGSVAAIIKMSSAMMDLSFLEKAIVDLDLSSQWKKVISPDK